MEKIINENQVFLILTDKSSSTIVDFYNEIAKASNIVNGEVCVLYHQKGDPVCGWCFFTNRYPTISLIIIESTPISGFY